jgi:hypothetical protein
MTTKQGHTIITYDRQAVDAIIIYDRQAVHTIITY